MTPDALGRNTYEEVLKSEVVYWREMATIDQETGLLNQATMNQAIEERIALGEKSPDDNFGIITYDVTGLKKINDYFGHEEGDKFLFGSIAKMLKRSLRSDEDLHDEVSHIPGRVGGDEFIILLDLKPRPDATDDQPLTAEGRLARVMERVDQYIVEVIASQPETYKALRINVARGGIVWQPGMSATQLKEAAEANMREHKKGQHEAEELPRRKKAARTIGRKLLQYSGIDSRYL